MKTSIHTTKTKTRFVGLAQRRFGRVLLHIVCLTRDGNWTWHWAGIQREFNH